MSNAAFCCSWGFLHNLRCCQRSTLWVQAAVCGLSRGGSCKANLAPGSNTANIAVYAAANGMKYVSFIIMAFVNFKDKLNNIYDVKLNSQLIYVRILESSVNELLTANL